MSAPKDSNNSPTRKNSRSRCGQTANRCIREPRRTRIEYGLFMSCPPAVLAGLAQAIENRALFEHQDRCDDVAKDARRPTDLDPFTAGDISSNLPGDHAHVHLH